MPTAACNLPAASPHASTTHSRRPLLTARVCRCVSHRIVFIDEELIYVTGIGFFGMPAAVPKVFSGQRAACAQASGDARPACPSERPRAHMGSRAGATAQPLRARSGARPLEESRANVLAVDEERQAGAADAPRTLAYGSMCDPYLYGWAPVHTA